MERRILFILICLASYSGVKAQMRFGIADNLNPSAVVQIDTADGYRKGLLMPRLSLRSTTEFYPLASHVQGMVVYNTVSAGSGSNAVSPGYYYNDGSKWNRVLSEKEIVKVWLNASGNQATNETEDIYRTGKMGLGVTNPTEVLDVNGNIKVSGGNNTGKVLLKQGTNTTSGQMEIYDPSNNRVAMIGNTIDFINYHTDDTLKHHVFTGGNIGVGTSTAPVKLVVNGAIKVGNESNTTNAPEAGMIRFNSTTGKFEGYNGITWLNLH